MISRLEEAVERAADGGGTTWNNPSGFLSHSKTSDEILTLIQVNTTLAEAIDLLPLAVSIRSAFRLVGTFALTSIVRHVVVHFSRIA